MFDQFVQAVADGRITHAPLCGQLLERPAALHEVEQKTLLLVCQAEEFGQAVIALDPRCTLGAGQHMNMQFLAA